MAINLTWKFVEPELDAIAVHEGRVVVIVSSDAKIDQLGRRVNKLTRGAVARAIESDAFEKASLGQVISLNYPCGNGGERYRYREIGSPFRRAYVS